MVGLLQQLFSILLLCLCFCHFTKSFRSCYLFLVWCSTHYMWCLYYMLAKSCCFHFTCCEFSFRKMVRKQRRWLDTGMKHSQLSFECNKTHNLLSLKHEERIKKKTQPKKKSTISVHLCTQNCLRFPAIKIANTKITQKEQTIKPLIYKRHAKP